MIMIERQICPKYLKDSSSKTAYRDDRVVHTLWNMQNEKCCYCEAKISVEGSGKTVDHWRPQSIFAGKKNDWANLLLACQQCNGKKLDQFPIVIMGNDNTPKVLYLKTLDDRDPAIIDPSDGQMDPEEYIDFVLELDDIELGLVTAKNRADKDIRGQTTIEVIGLDRDCYRKEHAGIIRRMMKEFCQLGEAKQNRDEEQVQSSLRQFEIWISSKSRYSAVARAFARRYKLDKIFSIQIPVGWN